MRARRTDPRVDRLAKDVGSKTHDAIRVVHVQNLRIAIATAAEGVNSRDSGLVSATNETLGFGDISRNERRSARRDGFENLCLRVGNSIAIAKEFEMRRRYRRDQRDMRTNETGERTDLAEMVHADLEHAVHRIARHRGKAEWNAPMIVVRSGRAMLGSKRAQC